MKAILVTGVSSGIGHALAAAWLARAVRVYGVSRRTPPDLVTERRFRFRTLDLRDHARAARVLLQLLGPERHLDVVVLNAGVLGPIAEMVDTSLAELQDVMAVNLWANKVVLDALFDSGVEVGQVVGISSGAAVTAYRGWGAYCISKAALNMLMRLYAADHPATHFCALAPGLIDTGMQDALRSLPRDDRFPDVEFLRSRQHTAEMPEAAAVAGRLLSIIEQLPQRVPSGGFFDARGTADS